MVVARSFGIASAGTALAIIAAACSSTSTPPTMLEPGSHNEMFTKDGALAMPLPRMASDVVIGEAENGQLPLTFSVAYAVSNTAGGAGVAADKAEVTVRVAPKMQSTGPEPDKQVFKEVAVDTQLDETNSTKTYSTKLSEKASTFLENAGLHSTDANVRTQALKLLNVGVQQFRDFKSVDGGYDWIEGTTFSAAAHPTATADSPGSEVTVTNATGDGIFQFATPAALSSGGFNGGALEPQYSSFQQVGTSTGVGVALGGAAVSCLYQGTDGSNPEGFSLPLTVGASVSQKIVADDESSDSPTNASDAANVSNAVEDGMKVTVEAFSIAAAQAFGGPFLFPIDFAMRFLNLGTACNNQPNVMQIAAATEDGMGTSSVNWAIWDGCNGTCGGLANAYNSPWSTTEPSPSSVVTDAVQLAPDPNYTFNGQPLWLTQQPVSGCGVGDASNSNTSGCTSQNVINIYWTTQPACPMATGIDVNGGMQGGNQYCYQPAPTSPEVDYCGTNNAGCPTYTDPNS